MDVILKQDVDELGLEGDVVKVAKGYRTKLPYSAVHGFGSHGTQSKSP
jgi:ribosomal protein L9